jgi:hypothetical protein
MPGDIHDRSKVKFTHNNNAGFRHELTMAVVLKIESNARTSGNTNTFFNTILELCQGGFAIPVQSCTRKGLFLVGRGWHSV